MRIGDSMRKYKNTDLKSVQRSDETVNTVLAEVERLFAERCSAEGGHMARSVELQLQLPNDLWYDGHTLPKNAKVVFYTSTSANGTRNGKLRANVTVTVTPVSELILEIDKKTVNHKWVAIREKSGSPRRILRP